jgi:hypothetical protein
MLVMYSLQRSATFGVGTFHQLPIVREMVFDRRSEKGKFVPRLACNKDGARGISVMVSRACTISLRLSLPHSWVQARSSRHVSY